MEDKGSKILFDLAREFAILKRRKEEIAAEEKSINGQIKPLQLQIMDLMIQEGNSQFRLEGVGLVYISILKVPKITSKEEFFKWLEDNDEAYIIQRTIHHKTLKTWFKGIDEKFEKEDKDIKEELKNMVEIFEEPQLNLRKK